MLNAYRLALRFLLWTRATTSWFSRRQDCGAVKSTMRLLWLRCCVRCTAMLPQKLSILCVVCEVLSSLFRETAAVLLLLASFCAYAEAARAWPGSRFSGPFEGMTFVFCAFCCRKLLEQASNQKILLILFVIVE